MNISRAGDYAIRVLVYMAKKPAGTVCFAVVNKSSCQNIGNCDVHFMWVDIQKMLSKALSSYSIADFANDTFKNKLPESDLNFA